MKLIILKNTISRDNLLNELYIEENKLKEFYSEYRKILDKRFNYF